MIGLPYRCVTMLHSLNRFGFRCTRDDGDFHSLQTIIVRFSYSKCIDSCSEKARPKHECIFSGVFERFSARFYAILLKLAFFLAFSFAMTPEKTPFPVNVLAGSIRNELITGIKMPAKKRFSNLTGIVF